MLKVFQNIPQRVIADKKIKNEFKNRFNELNKQEKILQKKMHDLEREKLILNRKERQKIEENINEERKVFASNVQNFINDNHIRQMEEQSKILIDIQKIVKKIAQVNHYQTIFDINSIVYSSNMKDITQDVIKKATK
ncbi:chaperone protein skp [Candidatus Tachikawaea gelatinosa]|uniref:Chaperone protein Skp n=2 Tax=Candidatus Tachikawaea gelatinosa TaxID=1410383 RepID=A0A090BWD2_9ENTR|nr:chaperone protein skp [Candidatus Tachikawaea gelatinosa]